EAFAAHDGAAVFGMVDQVVESGHDPRRFLADLLERFRDLLILNAVTDAAAGDPAPARALIDVPDDQFERMTAQARTFGAAELSRAADLVNTGLTEMRGATAPRLLLELVCARVLLPGADPGEQGLAARLDRLERRGVVLGSAAPAPMAPAAAGPRVVQDDYDEAPPPRRPQTSGPAPAGVPGAPALGTPPWDQGSGTSAATAQAATPQPVRQEPASVAGGLAPPPWAQDSAPTGDSGGAAGLAPPPWAQSGGTGTAAPPSEQESVSAAGAGNAPEPGAPEAPAPVPSPSPAPPAEEPAPARQPPGADIRRMWPDLLEEVKRRDGRVSWMLLSQNAQVLGMDGDRLQVAFINAGARDRFASRGTADTLRQAAQDLFGFRCQVDAIVDPSQTPGTPVASGATLTPPPPMPPPPSAYQAPQPQAAPPPAREAEPQQQVSPQALPPPPVQRAAPSQPQPQPQSQQQPQKPPQTPAPPPAPVVRPEDDIVSDDDEVLAEDNASAHELVIRELGAQRLDAEE
ncbi:MAG: DNA polymerase III subunit gamma and tau, partial [Catenulispora sp.]